MWFHLGAVLILAGCRAGCSPAFAGGLSKSIMPLDISRFNPPPPTETSDSASNVGCPKTDGAIPLYLPDLESCTKYTVCSGPFGMQMECPPGMHFSVKTSSCTFPLLANCPLLESATETINFTDLKGAPGIDATAYPAGIPSRDSLMSALGGNMGQLPALPSAAGPSTSDSGVAAAQQKKSGNGLRAAISGFLAAGGSKADGKDSAPLAA